MKANNKQSKNNDGYLKMHMKRILMAVCFCFAGLSGFCQDYNSIVDKKSRKFKYYFNGGFGFYFPGNVKDVLKERGSYTSFSFQVNYRDDFFSRLFFDVGNINYEREAQLEGTTTLIKNKLNSNFLGIDLGYNKSFRKFTPALFVGAGLFTMDVPKIDLDTISRIINFSTSRKDFFAYRVGASFEYRISELFLLYAEGIYLSVPYKTELDKRQLNGTTIQIGFKTPLQ